MVGRMSALSGTMDLLPNKNCLALLLIRNGVLCQSVFHRFLRTFERNGSTVAGTRFKRDSVTVAGFSEVG